MVIDNATLLIGIAFSSASLLLALTIGWLNARNESYLLLGATGMALIVCAVVIMGTNRAAYDVLQHGVSYSLILVGFSFIFAGTRRFRNARATLWPAALIGVIAVTITFIPLALGLTGLSTALLNAFAGALLVLCAVEHWRSDDHPRVALHANALIYTVTAFSFFSCAAVIAADGAWALAAPPKNWAEDFNAIMSIIGLTGIGALTLTLHYARAAQRHRDEANTDVLTGVLNRRALFDRFGNTVPATNTAVLMFDLDHFKQVNDRLGHAEGDRVLQRFAEVLQRELRRGDVPSRIGGEEFCAVLLAIDKEAARTIAERIRQSVADMDTRIGSTDLIATVSVGLAISAGDEDFSSLLNRADAALYQAKNGGRNQVRLAALRLVA
ncbi:diguanylate cyclase [Devosia sp.]|uniref:GGDEF domain-containing protein n=1 Tax=Devosia sp. TaxID=1871048 RepID=UPI001AD03F4E|nr:GGDEF domain-containing protein [Devosia sp.]MBN9334602.1 GGDEF domain-containing protein [Devosia sp.]